MNIVRDYKINHLSVEEFASTYHKRKDDIKAMIDTYNAPKATKKGSGRSRALTKKPKITN